MNATTKTLEQLQAEAQAAQEALRAAEQAQREAQREAERAAARKQQEERQQKIDLQRARAMAPVIVALHAAGIPAKPSDNGTGFTVPTAEGSWRDLKGFATMEQTRTSSYVYRTANTGRVLIELEGTTRDDRRRFPPLKSGGHNVDKIVATIKEWAAQSQAKVEAAQAQKTKLMSADELARQVRADNGLKSDAELVVGSYTVSNPSGPGRRYEYHTRTAAPGKVFVKVGTLELTPAQAKIVIDALAAVKAASAR